MGGSAFPVEELREQVISSTQPEPLERLTAAVKLALELETSADQLVDGFVAEARDAGCSWAQIGLTLGVTKQAAQQRFGFVTRIEPGMPPGRAVMQPRPEWLGPRVGLLLTAAEEEARQLGHNYVGTEHMLLALLEDREHIAAHALAALCVTADAVRGMTTEALGARDPREWECLGVRPRLKQALQLSQTEARRLGHSKVGSEHVLLGLLRVEDGLAVGILKKLGTGPKRVRAQLAEMIGVSARELDAKPGRRGARLIPR
jgi:hypothetical protein